MKRMRWYLAACPTCGGDVHDNLEDEGWATCLMCARSFRMEQLRVTSDLNSRRLAIVAGPSSNEAGAVRPAGMRAA